MLPFPLLEDAHIPWLIAPCFPLQNQQSCLSLYLSRLVTSPSNSPRQLPLPFLRTFVIIATQMI